MVVAGGPGTGLVDIGEAETSNLATAKEMSEQRRRFLRRRQTYFGYVLSTLTIVAWNRAQEAGLLRGRTVTFSDVILDFPDISVQDYKELADAAQAITTSLAELRNIFAPSSAMKRMALRLYLKFAGETITITVDGREVAELRPVARRRRWVSRAEFANRMLVRQADAALAEELHNLAPDTTDDLPW